jgi:hypothetical protein
MNALAPVLTSMTPPPRLARLLVLATLALGACHDSDDDGGASGPLMSLGVSAVSIAGGNGLWVLEVSEADEGATDLNGDGDALDRVAFLYRSGDGSLRNLELALSISGVVPTLVAVGDVLIGLVVRESAQGGTDLNGDGDAVDDVMHVYDDNTGVVTNTALATS